jgi:hypothetical protein
VDIEMGGHQVVTADETDMGSTAAAHRGRHRRAFLGFGALGAAAVVVAVTVWIGTSAGTGTDSAAAQTCAIVASRDYGTSARVVGAFDTTISGLREFSPWLGPLPSGMADGHAATLCYIDGDIPKSPPGGVPYDRAVVGVIDGQVVMLIAGYRDSLPVQSP